MSKLLSSKEHPSNERAQAIVEFAIVLPILMLLLIGILEVGRMLFAYASVINASREASRYASAVGFADDTSYYKYQYCKGIRDVAKKAAFLLNLSDSEIQIDYDHGTLGTTFDSCDGNGIVDTNVNVNYGANYDRVTVTIQTQYRPMVNLIPIPERTIRSISSRSILGIYELESTTGGGGWAPGAGPTPTKTPTPTATATATGGPTDTPTPKNPTKTPKFAATFTPVDTDTPTAPVDTATATATGTATGTATATSTPTDTPTPWACSSVSASAIAISNKTMTSSISNLSNDTLTISSITVTWNQGSGASGNKALALTKAEYGSSSFWSGSDPLGTHFFTLSPAITLPAGGTSSTFTFTFDKNYDFPTGRTSITFNLSAPSCGTFSITKSQ
jgi:Flp pilus assembly protein TadG